MVWDTLKCNWVREAVLPLNKELEADIFNKDVKIKNSDKKHCACCGKAIESKSNRSKYCMKCAIQIHKKKNAENMRKSRIKVYN
jgi:tRNA(Ile2) C34 agmatinyltransferase TiaS